MCWSGRDELREIEEEAEIARLEQRLEQQLADWRIASQRFGRGAVARTARMARATQLVTSARMSGLLSDRWFRNHLPRMESIARWAVHRSVIANGCYTVQLVCLARGFEFVLVVFHALNIDLFQVSVHTFFKKSPKLVVA